MNASDLLAARRAGRALAAVALASAFSLFATGARADAKRVHIRGTAYEFNNTGLRLGGATIRVAEHPRLHATTKPDGTYDLAVPDHARVTPYIIAAGHHSIYLQTFRTAGEDLDSRELPDARPRRSTAPWRPCSPSRSTLTASYATARSCPPSAPAMSAT